MCEHEWKEIKRRFNPPHILSSWTASSPEQANKIVYGFTNIELKCKKCGDIKHIQVAGRA